MRTSFNDVGTGPLVLEYKIYQQRPLYIVKDNIDMASLNNSIFMISLFKDGSVFIKILNSLKQIDFQTDFWLFFFKKRFLTAKHFLQL